MTRHALQPIRLTLAQRDQLMYFDKENLFESIVQHWYDSCPEDVAGISQPLLREIAITAVKRCSSYGITDAASQHLFAGLMMAVSPSFDDHSIVRSFLKNEDIPQQQRMGVMIKSLPSGVWEHIVAHKRMDALFEPARERSEAPA